MTDIKVNGTLTLEANIIDNVTSDFRLNGEALFDMVNGVISTDNSTSETIGASATYTGIYEEVWNYASITIIGTSTSDVTLYADQSIDGITADRTLELSDGTSYIGIHTLIPLTKYFRIRVVDGGSGSDIVMQTIYHTSGKIAQPTSRITQSINDRIDVLNTRSILTGQTIGGRYQNIHVRENKLNIFFPRASFGDMSSIMPTPVIQQNFLYNINTDIINVDTSTGTVTQSTGMGVLQTTAASSSHAAFETKRFCKYRMGQGVRMKFTAIFTTGVAGSKQMIGGFSDENGLGFGYNGTSFGCFRRNNSTDTWYPQSTWNFDTMDGSHDDDNPSGMLLDQTKGNVFCIQYQWLGFGGISFYIEEQSTGEFVRVHVIPYTNANTEPSTRNPSYPMAARVENTSNNTNITLKTASMSAEIEGKIRYLGPKKAISASKTSVGTTLTNIVTIQNKSTYAGATNYMDIVITRFSVAVDGTKPAVFRLILDGALGGTPSYTDISTNTSVVSYDVAGTTVTGGIVIDGSAISKDGSISKTIIPGDIYVSPGSTLTIAVASTASTTDVSAFINWIEDF